MRRCGLVFTFALLAACKREAPTSDPEPEQAIGRSLEAPILRCGAQESYAYVANVFTCPDGENPFRGDTRAAARSRSGSQKREGTGSFVDTYEVPCKSGNVTVYVDMYGCPDRAQATQGRKAAQPELIEAFDEGAYEPLVEHCTQAPDDGVTCLVLVPASLALMGDVGESEKFMVESLCASLPVHGEKSNARALFISYVITALDRGLSTGTSPLSSDAAVELVQRMTTGCQVPPEALYEISWDEFLQ